MTKSTVSRTAAKSAVKSASFVIERRANPKAVWKQTNHVVSADTANAALRKFGLRDAFKSTKVKVCTGGQTGRQYRAVAKTGK